MRNPDRLYKTYDIIRELHKTNLPDWRVGQLFENFRSWHIQKTSQDIFYLEENTFLEKLEDFIKEIRGE